MEYWAEGKWKKEGIDTQRKDILQRERYYSVEIKNKQEI